MGMTLEQVVPWGRSFEEYRRMFALSERDLQRRILGCADGPADFNAGMHARGHRVISADPLYVFAAEQIEQRIAASYATILAGARANLQAYVWEAIASPEALGQVRMAAMRTFLKDFPFGLRQGRYLAMSLPHLGFTDGAFDLALCSHLLFTYSQPLSLQFHLAAVDELCRVAAEVRVFPLLNMDGAPSPHLPAVLEHLQARYYRAEVVAVPYEFQRGGNQMLRVGKA